MYKKLLILALAMLIGFSLAGCGGGSGGGPTALNATLNPVLDFYINRDWNTDTDALRDYGIDLIGNATPDQTHSWKVNSLGVNYLNIAKQIFNFNISALSGATIQSAYFRIYLASVSGADTPPNAILENIFYGNTDSLPAPRNGGLEFGGYNVTPAISGTAAATAGSWIQINVTAKLQADITAGRSNSQFRLTHENITNLVSYNCNWTMEDSPTNKPELVITYTN